MGKYKLLVLSSPKDGCEDAYNAWYTNQHLGDVVAVPGFKSAQRFELINGMGKEHRHRYLAIYEIEADDPHAVVDDLLGRSGTAEMVISEALDVESAHVGVFAPCSPVVEAKRQQ